MSQTQLLSKQDLTGKTIGLWQVLRQLSKAESKRLAYWCLCISCNVEKSVYYYDLSTGRSLGCHKCRHKKHSPCLVYKRVIAAIASAKKKAIADRTYRMPYRQDLLKATGASLMYFCYKNGRSRDARAQYDAAVIALTDLVAAKPKFEPLKLVEKPMELTPIDHTKPSKETQLLAHLRLRKVPVKDLARLLAIEPREARWLIGRLEREGLVRVERSPFAKRGEQGEVVLVEQQQRKVG